MGGPKRVEVGSGWRIGIAGHGRWEQILWQGKVGHYLWARKVERLGMVLQGQGGWGMQGGFEQCGVW